MKAETTSSNRRRSKTGASSSTNKRKNKSKNKETMMPLSAHHPPPPGYSPYPPPPHPAYYYPYPYPPPPPYPHHQYAPMPPLQAPPTSSNSNSSGSASAVPMPPTAPPAQKKTKRSATKASSTKKSKRSQLPQKIVSTSVETEDAPPETESSAGTAAGSKVGIVPHENDVLMGRGGKNNTHVGNEKLREMARAMREVYIVSRKKVKTNMARQLVQQVFEMDPPGRFLQRDPVTMIWEEVDLDTARHKTSQCLRDAASEKSSYTKIGSTGGGNKAATGDEEDETSTPSPLPMETVESGTQTTITTSAETDRPSTPLEQISSSLSVKDDDIKRALTPVLSNMAHKIEPSPPQPQQLIDASPTRNRIESWESASFARNLIEAWEDNNGSFPLVSRTHPPSLSRRGSMDISCGSSSHHRRMYTWMSANAADMELEDAVLIPPEELDAVEDGDEFFSLLDDSQLDDASNNHKDEEMQIWQPEMYEESGSPFDTDFFY